MPGSAKPMKRTAFSCFAFALFTGAIFIHSPATNAQNSVVATSEAEGNALCAALFAADRLAPLRGKIPLVPGDIPERDMIANDEKPTDTEKEAIRHLEQTVRQCKAARTAAGSPTTASEDILEARISKYRHGLYTGKISYGAYSYGVVTALKKHYAFIAKANDAFEKGKSEGAAKAAAFAASQASARRERELRGLNDSLGGRSYWNCDVRNPRVYESRIQTYDVYFDLNCY